MGRLQGTWSGRIARRGSPTDEKQPRYLQICGGQRLRLGVAPNPISPLARVGRQEAGPYLEKIWVTPKTRFES